MCCLIYANNEPKSALARDLGDCRDNKGKLAKRVFTCFGLFFRQHDIFDEIIDGRSDTWIAFHGEQDRASCERIIDLIVAELFCFFRIFQQRIAEKDDAGLTAPRDIVGGLELVEVHDCIWLEAGMLADTHAAPVGVMIFLEHQKRLFRDKGKIDSWDLLVEKTAV